jgi:hypothetical protein
MRILRAFLGATFVYAGIQKFADRNFLRATPWLGRPSHVSTSGYAGIPDDDRPPAAFMTLVELDHRGSSRSTESCRGILRPA